MAEEIIDRLKQFKEKVNENYLEVKEFYNKELRIDLSQLRSKERTLEECDNLIGVLNEILVLFEIKATKSLMTVKDGLKQAKMDALETKLKYCNCNVSSQKKIQERPKRSVGSSTSTVSLTDSRLISDEDALVVQPSDASEDNNAGKDTDYMDTRL